MLDDNEKVIKMSKKKRVELIKEKTGISTSTKGNNLPKDFLVEVFNKNKNKIQETLDIIREIDPKAFIRAMLDIAKLTTPNENEVNVKHSLDIDLTELSKLGSAAKLAEINDGDFEYVEPIEEEPEKLHAHPSISEDLRQLGLPPIEKKEEKPF